MSHDRSAARLRAHLQQFPPVPWELVETAFPREDHGRRESLFAVANGYLGARGTHDEGTPAHAPGVLLNGFHETWPIEYPEDAYGLARTGQTIAPVPDGTVVRLFVDDELFDPATAQLLSYDRRLDLRGGVLTREVVWRTARGRSVLIRSRRFASLDDRHLLAVQYEVQPLDGDAHVTLSSELVTHRPMAGAGDDPRRGRASRAPVLRPLAANTLGLRAALELRTRRSGLHVAVAMGHAIETSVPCSVDVSAAGAEARVAVLAHCGAGDAVRLSKFVAHHWGGPGEPLAERAARTLDAAERAGFAEAEALHRRAVRAFWDRADVELDGAPDLQLAVRFSLFQVLQATARADGLGIPAKGLTGEGYEGHCFWDGEIFVAPLLVHTDPDRARAVLRFRCGLLDAARRRARELGHRGARFAWRTITGEEASAWYAAGTAQVHINADVAHALLHYADVTGDDAFLRDEAAEVLVETARAWLDLGFFSDAHDGAFCLNGVTGPDEYSTVVDNNAYTNLMAKENLEGAVRVVEWLAQTEPLAYARLASATGLTPEEPPAWAEAAARMRIPRDPKRGIVLQDEHFLERKPWDFGATPPERYPLLLHHHPLELYRHQVIKQADVVLASYLAGHRFDEDEVRRTFDFHDPLTTGDSTLSASIQSVVASACGYEDRALELFVEAAAVDLADAHGNTADGIHVASCGGTWLALVAGFAGLRDQDGRVRLRPRLPAAWGRLRFRIAVRGQLLEVDMTPRATAYRLVEGTGLEVEHEGAALRIGPGGAVSVPVARPDAAPVPLPRAA